MRLHTLALQAFGPFPHRVDVDFDTLDQGIVLVNGPTGSGKSSLLDAVTFALFGDVAGSRHSLRGAFRSHHAAPDTAPWVEVEFSVGPERWKVRRAPAWDAPKRRGSGTTTRPSSVLLSQWRDGQWHLVSSRIDEAAEMVRDTLGMGLEQFAQVVLLPQGEFAQFLRAKPEDRRALLERLFDVHRFDAVERWFTERKNDRLRASDSSLERVRGHMMVVTDTLARLDDAELPLVEWTDEHVGDLPEQLRSLLAVVRARCDAVQARADLEARLAEGAERSVERAVALTSLRAAHQRACDDLDAWPSDVVEAMKRDAEAADHVAGVLRLAQRADRAASRLEDARAARKTTTDALAAVLGIDLAHDDVDIDELLPLDGLNHLSHTLHALQVQVPGYVRALDDLAAASNSAATAREQSISAEASLARARTDALTRDRAVDAAHEKLALTPDVQTRLASLEAASRLLADVPSHRARLQKSQSDAQSARRTFVEHERTVIDLRVARLAGMAAEMATDLVDGQPCPVCGSCDHPAPASPSPQAPDAEQIARAEALTREAADALRRADADLAGAQQEWTSHLLHLQARLDESTLTDEGPLDAAAVAEDPAAFLELEHELHERQRRHENARMAVDDAADAHERATRAVVAAEKQAVAALARWHASDERITVARAGVGEARDAVIALLADDSMMAAAHRPFGSADLPALLSVSADVSTADERSMAREFLNAVEQCRTHLHEGERARAAHGRADESFRAARTQSLTVESELADELVAKGYDNLEAARVVALDEDELTSLRATWQHAIEVRAAANATLADDLVIAASLTPPANEERLRRRAEILARRSREASAEAARWSQARTVLTSMRDRIVDAVRDHLPVARAAREMSDLASTFGGNGENTHRMRLTSYVLAAHLETVTTMANDRLHHMSDGRYQLRYTDERVKGNQRSGLSLLVVDAWTGRARETATLSGGEAFMASLALALGLGDAVRADSGGMELHTLFVDEGFGSLDQDTLEQVMEVLDGLREGGRLVGVVSHVSELRARIPSRIEVRKTSEGSSVHTTAPSASAVSAHL